MNQKPLFDAIRQLSDAISKYKSNNTEFSILLPYGVRQMLINECESITHFPVAFRGTDSFTLFGLIHIKPTENETKEKLQSKVDRAKTTYEEAQKEYDTIIGGKNG
jgi:hypothetical protein